MKSLFYSQIWKEAPFVRLVIPLAAGIVLQFFFPISKSFNAEILIFCGLGLGFSLFVSLFTLFGREWMTGILVHFAFFSLGRLLIAYHQDSPVSIPPHILRQNMTWVARLENDPVKKTRSYKCMATISYLYTNRKYYREKEKIFIYFAMDHPPDNTIAGTVIVFQKPLLPIENTASGFDYRSFCRFKHIYAQAFLRPTDYALLETEGEKGLRRYLDSWRKEILRILKRYVPDKEENGLLEALMIGYTDDLDRELVQSYSNTGVVHIIAISGLHLALIYEILEFLLQRIKNRKAGRQVKLIILLSCLWIFSLVSGASPSVIRSAVMFTILLLARNLSRESVVYNSLASSAFLLLCFDPFWLWDTGFQLSYAAVLSLVIFLKPIRDLLRIQNKLLGALWNSASISMAAQVLTTPISLYYFHRFPNYFLFSNLLAVPLSSLILTGGILLCIFSFSPLLARFLGCILDKAVGLLNGFIQYTAGLPGAVTDHLTVNLGQLLLLYLMIWCIYRYFTISRFLKTKGL